MFFTYIKIAFRQLRRSKIYGLLNITGLAIGIAIASLIFLWVESELTYNDYFQNKDRIYSVLNKQSYDGETFVFNATPGPLQPALQQDFPEIEASTRIQWNGKALFTVDQDQLYARGGYADPGFLDIFSLNILFGQKSKLLIDQSQIIISDVLAQKLFGKVDVVDEVLRFDNQSEYKIAAVFEDIPKNNSYRAEWILPFDIYFKKNNQLQGWGNNALSTVILKSENASIDAINKKLYPYIANKTANQNANNKLLAYPMSRWVTHQAFDKDGNEQEGRIKYIRLFTIIAWIILLIACINFMNLATARSQKRAKEIGVKKVIGASRTSLIKQFLIESIILTCIAVILALLLMYVTLPFFNTITGKQMELDLLAPRHLIYLVGIALICGLMSGSYPAFYLSSFKPITVLKGFFHHSSGSIFTRKILVVLQFMSSITLVICAIIIVIQIKHVKNRPMGFEKADIINTRVYPDIKKNYTALKDELEKNRLISDIGLSTNSPLHIGSNTGDFTWEGKDINRQVLISIEQVDHGYIPTNGIKLAIGRNFKTDSKADSNNIIINATLAKIMKISDDPIGKTINNDGSNLTVIGVVEDYRYNSMYNDIAPLILYPHDDLGNISVRLASTADRSKQLAEIESIFKKYNPQYPFEYWFLDDSFNNLFSQEVLVGKLTNVFAILAVIISCLGLLGLAAFTAERRRKEIAIRKVIGANNRQLVNLLNKEFIILVLVASIISFPISYYIMDTWLSGYAYRIGMPYWVFPLALILALALSLVTVSSQALRAALSKPVNNLKDE